MGGLNSVDSAPRGGRQMGTSPAARFATGYNVETSPASLALYREQHNSGGSSGSSSEGTSSTASGASVQRANFNSMNQTRIGYFREDIQSPRGPDAVGSVRPVVSSAVWHSRRRRVDASHAQSDILRESRVYQARVNAALQRAQQQGGGAQRVATAYGMAAAADNSCADDDDDAMYAAQYNNSRVLSPLDASDDEQTTSSPDSDSVRRRHRTGTGSSDTGSNSPSTGSSTSDPESLGGILYRYATRGPPAQTGTGSTAVPVECPSSGTGMMYRHAGVERMRRELQILSSFTEEHRVLSGRTAAARSSSNTTTPGNSTFPSPHLRPDTGGAAAAVAAAPVTVASFNRAAKYLQPHTVALLRSKDSESKTKSSAHSAVCATARSLRSNGSSSNNSTCTSPNADEDVSLDRMCIGVYRDSIPPSMQWGSSEAWKNWQVAGFLRSLEDHTGTSTLNTARPTRVPVDRQQGRRVAGTGNSNNSSFLGRSLRSGDEVCAALAKYKVTRVWPHAGRVDAKTKLYTEGSMLNNRPLRRLHLLPIMDLEEAMTEARLESSVMFELYIRPFFTQKERRHLSLNEVLRIEFGDFKVVHLEPADGYVSHETDIRLDGPVLLRAAVVEMQIVANSLPPEKREANEDLISDLKSKFIEPYFENTDSAVTVGCTLCIGPVRAKVTRCSPTPTAVEGTRTGRHGYCVDPTSTEFRISLSQGESSGGPRSNRLRRRFSRNSPYDPSGILTLIREEEEAEEPAVQLQRIYESLSLLSNLTASNIPAMSLSEVQRTTLTWVFQDGLIASASSPPQADEEASLGGDEDKSLCQICLSHYSADDIIRCLPCFHRFHDSCVMSWLINNGDCPVCKRTVGTSGRRVNGVYRLGVLAQH